MALQEAEELCTSNWNEISYLLDRVKLLELLLKEKGIILADNILSHYEKVEDYVDNLFSNKNYQSQILKLGTGMMLSRKA